MKYAIVENGGKQYKAVEGSTIEVDLIPTEVGEHINLEKVLLFVDGDEVKVGAPEVNGAIVKTTVVSHIKGPKIIVFKYRPKKRIRVKTGHRQKYTRLMVDSIQYPGKVEEVKSVELDDSSSEKPRSKPSSAGKKVAPKTASNSKTVTKKPKKKLTEKSSAAKNLTPKPVEKKKQSAKNASK